MIESAHISLQVSTVILTRNEEQDLPVLLQSLDWCKDIHVVDDRSSDSTLAVARASGAHCYSQPFHSFGTQRNWALEHCDIQNSWVLFLDADEVSTPSFVAAVAKSLEEAPSETAGFYCCWKLILDGIWLRRCDGFPKWQLRLVRRGRATFTDAGHGQKEGNIEGRLDYISEPYLHYAFSKGWTAWFDRHNRYSSQEARSRIQTRVSLRDIISSNPSTRNKALKPLVSRLPGWPGLRFLCDYVFRLGFTEGRAGLVYCLNMAIYEYLIRLKMREMLKEPGTVKSGMAS